MFHCVSLLFFFFFKQKTAYEMRISDWSSDVCSSDLSHRILLSQRYVLLIELVSVPAVHSPLLGRQGSDIGNEQAAILDDFEAFRERRLQFGDRGDRKSVV